MKTTWKAWLAVLVPLAVMLGWAGYHAATVARGVKVRLRVEGFDPRDLLSGHYLRYRVDYGLDGICAGQAEPTCVCLERPGGGEPARAGWTGSCEARPDCHLWLRGRCSSSRFEAGIERFYFPETLARPLAVVPPDATIEVALDGRGGGIVSGFFVGDEPLLDYARRQ